jgi:hypothetical protein
MSQSYNKKINKTKRRTWADIWYLPIESGGGLIHNAAGLIHSIADIDPRDANEPQ